jgi:hypothetical protein
MEFSIERWRKQKDRPEELQERSFDCVFEGMRAASS